MQGVVKKPAEFEYEEIPDASVKVLKQRKRHDFAAPPTIPVARLLQDDCPLDGNQTFRPGPLYSL